MTTDEHPEYLLDRALNGHADAAERTALDLHLTACSACALHLALATQLRDGAAATRDKALNRRAIAGALARLQSPPRVSAWRFGRISLRLAVASGLLFVGLAAAAVSLGTARTPRPAAETTHVGKAPGGRPVPATASPETPATASPETPALASALVDGLAPEASATGSGGAFNSTSTSASRTPPATKAPSAAALFARASDQRHQGRLDQAIHTYRFLQQRYPSTREAKLSYALAGRLQLERGRPAQALAEFDRYLKVDAEVTEEVLAWRTGALRQLGRRREEAAVWRLLLARFPGSIYTEQARARLAALAL